MTENAQKKPLDGYRVLDLTGIVLGPLASLCLADLGAEIIKVEPPGGDGIRNAGAARNAGMGSIFLALNRNKKSIALDLSQATAKPILHRLVSRVDVVMHNMRPDAARNLGIDYESLRAINPGLIYCSASGFAKGTPRADDPAVDDVIQAATGMAALLGETGDAPRYVPALLADKVTGLVLAQAVLAALLARERFGQGQAIDVPMFETMAGFSLLEHLGGKSFEPPLGKAQYGRLVTPYRRPMRTSDGFMAFTPYSQKQWQRFFIAAGRRELADDPRVTDAARRNREVGALYELVADLLVKKPSAHWMDIARKEGIPAAPVQSFDEILDDPHLQAQHVVMPHHHPDEGALLAIGPLLRLHDCAITPSPAPRLGEQTRDVLAWAGYNELEISAFHAARTVLSPPERPSSSGISG